MMLIRTQALMIFLGLGLMAAGVLPGCAVYRKCGFAGCLGDAGITSQVRARLVLHPVLEPPNLISVQTLDGVVYLYGLVDTVLERQLAAAVALQTPGVARVVNSIGISGNR
jgi:osmotically-inducible protein OsmY